MAILIVRGPRDCRQFIRGPLPLPRPLLQQLVARAAEAGCALAIRSCAGEQELLDALRVAGEAGVEALVLEPGACAGRPGLRRALARLPCPHVEVAGPEPSTVATTDAQAAGGLASVRGYGVQDHALALAIVLEHLGRAEQANRVHIGT